MEKNNQEASGHSPPATRPPSDSSISSCRSSLSHHEDDGSLHPPSPPLQTMFHQTPVEPVAYANRAARTEPVTVKKKKAANTSAPEVGVSSSSNSERRRAKTTSLALSEGAVKKAALGFRVLGSMFCLVSFSIMAADKRKGWALDSYDRYIEFRYSLVVNVLGFVYSALQGFNLAYQFTSAKLVFASHLRYVFDFAFDQMLAYLLISSSSSAAIRADDWKSNWGKDDFTNMASASVAVSFMAFVSLAFSSLISGYTLCTL